MKTLILVLCAAIYMDVSGYCWVLTDELHYRVPCPKDKSKISKLKK